MGILDAARSVAHLSIRIVGLALAPDACAACDQILRLRTVFCSVCAATVELPHAPARAVAGAAYGGAVAEAIRRLKYGSRPDLAEPLAHLVLAAIEKRSLRADVVVPVPLHPRRLADRGYNQALLVARVIADGLDLNLRPRALERRRFAPPQASLTQAARLENLRDVFRVRRRSDVEGKTVALVDDVFTTGATFEACRTALLESGAVSVTPVVIAETPLLADPRTADPKN